MTSVKVAVRVRPLNQREINLQSKFIIGMQDKKTTITNFKVPESNVEGDSAREWFRNKEFTYDFSFWTVDKSDTARYHSQQHVYRCLGVDVVQSGCEGYNACVFAYGQTGSGKTYTMMGTNAADLAGLPILVKSVRRDGGGGYLDDKGIIPRICEALFDRMNDESTSYRTEVSYLEIYNEKVKDLLKSSGRTTHSLRVREHPKEGPYVQGLSKYIVNCYEDIAELMYKGNSVRTTASTNMNDTSSRSHAIFTIVFTQATMRDGIPSEKTSKIHLVDLAGSERATATGATGQRLREGASINKSLVSLGNVISQLAELSEKSHSDKGSKVGKPHFIPYRDSVLTWLLKDSLGGNSRTIMIATISPADVNYAETLSTLRYANRAKNIINRPTVNEDLNVKIIRELREEISRLKALLGGDIDNITTPKVKERLHENEARVKVLTDEWTEKWKEAANILQEQSGTLALRKEGLGVVLDSALPHLIGIDDDILSTGIMLYHLKEGKTRIGTVDAREPVDIVIAGLEVEEEHCIIENSNNTVTLTPVGEAVCAVNGTVVHESTNLTQGAVILLGKTNMFRFNNPVEAAKMKKELKKSGLSLSLSRTSLLSQSMTDLYKISDNVSGSSSGFEMDQSHREAQEKLEEIRQELQLMESKYHEADNERINQQVAMEMELEKKQHHLEQAEQEIEKMHQEMMKEKGKEDVTFFIKLPKGEQIDELLRKLEEKESLVLETAKSTKECLMQEASVLRKEQEDRQKGTETELSAMQYKVNQKEGEIQKLNEELSDKTRTINDQLNQKTQFIHVEEEQLHKLHKDFQILFHEKLEANESLQETWQQIEEKEQKLKDDLEKTDNELNDRWKRKIEDIAKENKIIEEAWKDIEEQETKYESALNSGNLTESERIQEEFGKKHLEETKALLKLEEESVTARERTVLDEVEKEMDEWEHRKSQELEKVNEQKKNLQNQCKSEDLECLRLDISNKDLSVQKLKSELMEKENDMKEVERNIALQKQHLIQERNKLEAEWDCIQQRSVSEDNRAESLVIELNQKISEAEKETQDQLQDIDDERQRLMLLKNGPVSSDNGEEGLITNNSGYVELDLTDFTEEEKVKLQQKMKDLEDMQKTVEETERELEEKVRQFDELRDRELDQIEFERMRLQEMERQDRINALVEQEVKRRLFEEKLNREQRRQVEREKDKREREEEIKRLKEAHNREIKQLRAKYEKKTERKILTPTMSNPYATVMPADGGSDIPRSKSTGSISGSLRSTPPPSINITIPSYRLQNFGADTHYEYEVKIVIGDEVWSVSRRYSKFRQLHQDLKVKYPEVGALVFPPKKWFSSKSEKVASERRKQLEFYLRSVIEICSRVPSCPLHTSQNQFLSKHVLIEFEPFFRKGLFETTKHGTT